MFIKIEVKFHPPLLFHTPRLLVLGKTDTFCPSSREIDLFDLELGLVWKSSNRGKSLYYSKYVQNKHHQTLTVGTVQTAT